MATEERPHVVVAPFPAQGHLPPMVHLSRHLASRGFIVTLVNLESVHRTLTNMCKGSLESGLDIRFEKLRSSMDLPFGLDASARGSARFNWCLEQELLEKEFEQLLTKTRPRCVVSDYFFFGGVSASRRMGIPAVCYFPGNVAWSSIHHHLDLLKSNGDLDSCEDKVITYIPGIEELRSKHVPDYLRVKERRKWMEPCARSMQDCDWILVNSFEELEPSSFRVMREEVLGNNKFVPVAPLFELQPAPKSPGSLRKENDECIVWLDSRAPGSVLYISFGSLSTISEVSMEQLAKGLEDSNQPFLWVVRQDLVQDRGPQLDSKLEEFVRKTEGQGLVVSWAPQLKVLAHPATGGFLSHCGWNSIMESLCNGVPMLCSPCLGDQVLNAKMVTEDFKMGTKYEATHAAEVIEKFMAGKEEDVVSMRSRVVEFKSKAQAAVSEGGSSYKNLNKFMDEMRMYC